MTASTVVREQGQGEAYWMLGGLYEVKVSGAESDGELTLMQMTIPAGMGPPPHTHPGGETVCVLDGRIRYHIGGETHEGGPGSCFHVPAGIEENFEPLEETRLLVAYTPGGVDRFFAEAGEPAARRVVPPPPEGPPDMARLMEISERYGVHIHAPVET
ncbi:MAG TPA: cupin domain-containing protein [Thermoleophilaceae bacterium]